ncbi:MAG: hypothetical protein HC817_10555 [Saprospiraceae bacterium]|nr:hypothetical protein [Saprospiraceae bacterium]
MRHTMTVERIRLRFAIALVLLRGVASRYKPEIQLVMLLSVAFIGNRYFNFISDYGFALAALFRKYFRN